MNKKPIDNFVCPGCGKNWGRCVLPVRCPCGETTRELPPDEPTLMQMATHYRDAITRYHKTGRPQRSDSEVDLIVNKICGGCDDFDGRRCRRCGCRVNVSKRSLLNKARMASESCPRGLWGQPNFVGEGYRTEALDCWDHQALLEPIGVHQLAELGPAATNASLIAYDGGLLLAYRDRWQHAQVRIAELDGRLTVASDFPVDIPITAHNKVGREDPRLFVHRGELHLAYIGVQRGNRDVIAHQHYCRLDGCYQVTEHFEPAYKLRGPWEKNWQFFDVDGQLRAVYSIAPQIVLRIAGEQVQREFETPWPCTWSPTMLRGGASPVLVGDEFYSFFHSKCDTGDRPIYSLGLYTFDARPPFAVRRIAPGPLMVPDPADHSGDRKPFVIFPAGAVFDPDYNRWLVSYGYHDHAVRIAELAIDDVEDNLIEAPRYQ